MPPRTLRYGSVSPGALRAWTALLAAIAVVARLAEHFASGRSVPAAPAPLREFLVSPEHLWSDPPLPGIILSLAHHFADPVTILVVLELVATVTVVALLVRLGERWLDYRVGLFAAAAWALCAPAVAVFRVPGSEGWQAALAILCVAAMLLVARRRAPVETWRVGVVAGALSLFTGGGAIWVVATAIWLPATSRRFRGRNWFILAGTLLAGWVVVVLPVVVRNAVVSGGEVILPFAWTQSVDPGSIGRHLLALLGGWLPPVTAPAWTLAWAPLVLLAWAGVIAMLPGARFLFPLLLGGIVPLVRGGIHGVDPGVILSATPFVCVYASYGVWRAATGRRSPITWVAFPAILVVAALFHLAVRAG